jgi:hypothetical protein
MTSAIVTPVTVAETLKQIVATDPINEALRDFIGYASQASTPSGRNYSSVMLQNQRCLSIGISAITARMSSALFGVRTSCPLT